MELPGRFAIAATAIPVQQVRGAVLPIREVSYTALAAEAHQGCPALPPWPGVSPFAPYGLADPRALLTQHAGWTAGGKVPSSLQ